MILIAANFNIQEGKREQALSLAKAMALATMEEPGCISYTFYADLDNPHKFFLFEEWQGQEDLDKHFQTEHMAEFRKQLPEVLAGKVEVMRYQVSDSGPL